ncbi:hypothetical protein AND_002525 [Anopheles darlingi]|uniref:Chitin-binding type-2 domain-containing protein n=1 Tax=Anopheles darlingi TaxID=43151 RepID=W5JQX4_ANODA|nr:hypothetical protein AND_002525 [Anopheles darlingi]
MYLSSVSLLPIIAESGVRFEHSMAQCWKFALLTILLGSQLIHCVPLNGRNVICPELGNEDLVFPHEYECHLYYLCSSEGAYLMQCLNGYHFSVTTRRCEAPEIAQCDPNVPLGSDPTLPTTPSITGPTSATTGVTDEVATFTPPTAPTGTPPTAPTGTPLTTEHQTTTITTEDPE